MSLVKEGNNISLKCQLFDSNTGKYVRAFVYDNTDTQITGSPVLLSHVNNGLYTDRTLVMPNTAEIKVQIKVYDDAAFTKESVYHCDVEYNMQLDTFTGQLENIQTDINTLLVKGINKAIKVDVKDKSVTTKIGSSLPLNTTLKDKSISALVDNTSSTKINVIVKDKDILTTLEDC